ncbi:hypothetical protein [Formosa haliotis]|uniref:hypothetical protein n=1 Tax=Formosa haliotis TaxID=1555194 RepID=UPI0008269ECD|nr:hypothetical protein [Formosa haliotis]
MKAILCTIILAVLALGCQEKKEKQLVENNSVTSEKSVKDKSIFKATLGDKTYEVEIQCSYFNEDYFQFKSDKFDVGDSNGDGINISGFQDGKKLILSIEDQGVHYSSPGVLTWKKMNDSFTGEGELYEEGSVKKIKVKFSGECK